MKTFCWIEHACLFVKDEYALAIDKYTVLLLMAISGYIWYMLIFSGISSVFLKDGLVLNYNTHSGAF
jgi:hypothetical protein